jgi:hypothetical protein
MEIIGIILAAFIGITIGTTMWFSITVLFDYLFVERM